MSQTVRSDSFLTLHYRITASDGEDLCRRPLNSARPAPDNRLQFHGANPQGATAVIGRAWHALPTVGNLTGQPSPALRQTADLVGKVGDGRV